MRLTNTATFNKTFKTKCVLEVFLQQPNLLSTNTLLHFKKNIFTFWNFNESITVMSSVQRENVSEKMNLIITRKKITELHVQFTDLLPSETECYCINVS